MILVGDRVAVSPEQIDAVRDLMIGSLIVRGHVPQEAETAVQDVVQAILARPESFAFRLTRLDQHAPYFIRSALNASLARLRTECRRREESPSHPMAEAGPEHELSAMEVHEPGVAADLCARQRQYLRALFADGWSLNEVAITTATTWQTVRGELRRAAAIMRGQRARRQA